MMLQGMAAAAAGHPGSLHHALQSPPNSNAAAINPAGGFLFLPQNPNAGMQGQQMHPGRFFIMLFYLKQMPNMRPCPLPSDCNSEIDTFQEGISLQTLLLDCKTNSNHRQQQPLPIN